MLCPLPSISLSHRQSCIFLFSPMPLFLLEGTFHKHLFSYLTDLSQIPLIFLPFCDTSKIEKEMMQLHCLDHHLLSGHQIGYLSSQIPGIYLLGAVQVGQGQHWANKPGQTSPHLMIPDLIPSKQMPFHCAPQRLVVQGKRCRTCHRFLHLWHNVAGTSSIWQLKSDCINLLPLLLCISPWYYYSLEISH